MAYAITIKSSAQKELKCLPAKDRRLIESRIIALSTDPHPVGFKALKGKIFKGLYRIRSGNYRIIYQVLVEELIILVVKIGDRKDVYG